MLEGAGDWSRLHFPRSAVKALQALPLIESGAADRFGFDPGDLALAVSSHNGEPCHTERAAAILGRVGLDEDALRCGAHPPSDRETADELGMRPMARWVGSAVAGVYPGVMGYGPVPATEKLLARTGLTLDELRSRSFVTILAGRSA